MDRELKESFHTIERSEVGVIIGSTNWRRFKRNALRYLNLMIFICFLIFLLLHFRNHRAVLLESQSKTSGNAIRDKKVDEKKLKDHRKATIKVPWRFQLEDDGFVFPRYDKKEKYITYKPSPISWPKQLVQFENAVVFAHLLERTLIAPPLIPERVLNQNISDIDSKHQFPISQVIDFNALSKVVSLQQKSLGQLEEIRNTKSVYKICHDHRLGFWVDFIPSVEDIQIWRLLKSQQFTAFPISLDDREVDLMCPGTLQYGNRWGPPMKVKPIIRGIMTELYEREEDVIYFDGDTLSTKDLRFFDKKRTKQMQEILIFHIQFSKHLNMSLMKLMKYLGRTYNAIMSGPLSGNYSFDSNLALRMRAQGFHEVSKTTLISCRSEDEHKFKFLQDLGYDLVFANHLPGPAVSNQTRFKPRDMHELRVMLLCAYASKFIALSGPSDGYYVEHLRLQNVTMKDSLVTDKINVRWAKHTQLPKTDERVLLQRQNSTKAIGSNEISVNKTNKILSKNNTVFTSKFDSWNVTKAILAANTTRTTIKANITGKMRSNGKKSARKPRSKLSIMVCTFCMYIKRITGEHGCPTIAPWCP